MPGHYMPTRNLLAAQHLKGLTEKSNSRWVKLSHRPLAQGQRCFCYRFQMNLSCTSVGSALAQLPPGSLPVFVSASGFSGFITVHGLESLAGCRVR